MSFFNDWATGRALRDATVRARPLFVAGAIMLLVAWIFDIN